MRKLGFLALEELDRLYSCMWWAEVKHIICPTHAGFLNRWSVLPSGQRGHQPQSVTYLLNISKVVTDSLCLEPQVSPPYIKVPPT